MILTRTQQAICTMVTDSVGFKWTSHNNADRSVARSLVLSHIDKAPTTLSPADFDKMMQGKKYRRTKDFLATLANALQDDVWKVL